jgi:hypothetical protein
VPPQHLKPESPLRRRPLFRPRKNTPVQRVPTPHCCSDRESTDNRWNMRAAAQGLVSWQDFWAWRATNNRWRCHRRWNHQIWINPRLPCDCCFCHGPNLHCKQPIPPAFTPQMFSLVQTRKHGKIPATLKNHLSHSDFYR